MEAWQRQGLCLHTRGDAHPSHSQRGVATADKDSPDHRRFVAGELPALADLLRSGERLVSLELWGGDAAETSYTSNSILRPQRTAALRASNLSTLSHDPRFELDPTAALLSPDPGSDPHPTVSVGLQPEQALLLASALQTRSSLLHLELGGNAGLGDDGARALLPVTAARLERPASRSGVSPALLELRPEG